LPGAAPHSFAAHLLPLRVDIRDAIGPRTNEDCRMDVEVTSQTNRPRGNDWASSIVVFLVALPLCMGVAIASGAPPAAGLITGIVGGILVGSISGAPLQVSGPAAGLSVIMMQFYGKFGAERVGMIVLLGGALQLVAGVFKFGQWFRAVSPAVIQGMLAGIGVLIFASQFHVMIDDAPHGGGLANLIAIPGSVILGIGAEHRPAMMIGLTALVVIIFWKPLAPGALKKVPAPLVAVVVSSVAVTVMGLDVRRVIVPDNLLDAVRTPPVNLLSEFLTRDIWVAAVTIALVASAETLLCAGAVDQMHDGPKTQYDRELAAQGVGNMICGLLGALPMTGVIVRSSANVEAGARTRLSTVLHGVWLVLLVSILPTVLGKLFPGHNTNVLTLVPVCGLAAILVFTGYKLVNPKSIKTLWALDRAELAIYVVTVAVIVAVDLLTGVVTGVALAAAKLLWTFTHLAIQVDREGNRTVLHLRGSATFLRLPKLAAVLDAVAPSTELHVHLEELNYIDHACLDLITNWEKQHRTGGGKLVIDWDSLTARFRGAGNGRSADSGKSAVVKPAVA